MAARDPIKVYDARWEVGEFSDAEVRRLFEAALLYGRELGVDTVTISRDARVGAPAVVESALEVAREGGFRVELCTDPISTPLGYFLSLRAAQAGRNVMGLTVTASHNPASYIGVKFTVPQVRAVGLDCGPTGGLSRVRELYHGTERLPRAAAGPLTLVDPVDEYLELSARQAGVGAGSLRGFSVVLDSMNGSAGNEIYRALTTAGVAVEPLRLVPNGAFPDGSPNPTSQGKMQRAIARAAEVKGALAIGVDGDGDRIVFADGSGPFDAGFASIPVISALAAAERAAPAAARSGRAGAAADDGAGRIFALCDPKVSPVALEQWSALGAQAVLFRNGHSQIKEYMTKIGAQFGAEESGHYYHRLHYDKLTMTAENSVVTILLFLKAIVLRPEWLGDLRARQQSVRTTGEINFQFSDDAARDAAIASALELLRSEGAQLVSATPDGIDLGGTQVRKGVFQNGAQLRLEAGWYSGYLRVATNERAVVRTYFTSGDASALEAIEEKVRARLVERCGGVQIE